MATLIHGESRCMYSWWWDSHISPKDSKWLQENLSDMDKNIKAMIKLIDEDGDSFARKAEMFYKKRPELMQLMEEFYRAYRALAEKYDHANSALRQAHQTMSEAFPNQIPPLLHLEEFDENELLSSNKELKQLSRQRFYNKVEESEGLKDEVKNLQDEVSRLLIRNENLMREMALESKHAQALEETIFKLESKKEEALVQYKLAIERISRMEIVISDTRLEQRNVNNEMLNKLKSVEEQCNATEKINKTIKLELEKKKKELEELSTLIEEEHNKRVVADVSLTSLEKIHAVNQEEAKHLKIEIQTGNEKLKDMELSKICLEDKINELTSIIDGLHEQIRTFKSKIEDLQDEVKSLKATKRKLEYEMCAHIEENAYLKSELCCLNDQIEAVSIKNLLLENSLSDANVEIEGLKEKANEVEASCEILLSEVTTHVIEKGVLVNQMESISQYMERLSKKNTVLEKSLFDANSEIKGLRTIFKFLSDQKSDLLTEKSILINQLKNLECKYLELQNQYSNIEKEKKSSVHQNKELEIFLKLEIREHENLILSFSSRLASLNNQIHLLQKEIHANVEDIEMEQQNVTSSSFEIFILQQCLCDMNDKIFAFSQQYQSLREASNCCKNVSFNMEDKIWQLQLQVNHLQSKNSTVQYEYADLKTERDSIAQQLTKLESSLRVEKQEHEELLQTTLNAQFQNFVLKKCFCDIKDHNSILAREFQNLLEAHRRASHQQEDLIQNKEQTQVANRIAWLLEALSIDTKNDTIANTIDDVLWQRILVFISETLDVNQGLQIEISVLFTLLKQIGLEKYLLYNEAHKRTNEVHKCEGEIRTLLNDIQVSTVNASMFEEKVVELILACESLEILSMSRREILHKEIALKNDCIEELKKNLDNLKGENSSLKADLNAYSSLLMSLSDGIISIEEHIISLAKFHEGQDDGTLDTPKNKITGHQPTENGNGTTNDGFLNLRKLIAKVEALQMVLIDTKNHLDQERFDSNANLESARRRIEKLKLNKILIQEISKENYGQITKDVQLDQLSNSCINYYMVDKNDKVETDDQMLELWETSERDDIELISIDKLEVSTAANKSSPRKWYENVTEKLDSNAERLLVSKKNLHELEAKIEYGTFIVQLREVEKDILEEIDVNAKLKKEVEDNFESYNKKKHLSEQARKGSEKIGKLELEIQKIEYVFLKIKEEEENKKCRCGDKKSSIISMKYLQFKRDGKVKKKSPFCGCMKPKTKV